jgi:hypothetical protein
MPTLMILRNPCLNKFILLPDGYIVLTTRIAGR